MTRRRFNSLFDRIDRHALFTEPLDVSAHWIRHTTLADVAAVSGLRVAAAYAGHAPESLGVIGRYTRVDFEDLGGRVRGSVRRRPWLAAPTPSGERRATSWRANGGRA